MLWDPMQLYKVIENTQIYRIIIWYYVQNAVSRGVPNLVLWSRDIVPLAEMMTRSRAPSVYSDREVGNSAEVGYFEPGLDYCLGGPDSVFVLADLVCGSSGCGGRPVCGCVRGSCVRVCQRFLCAGVSEGPV